MPRPYIRRRLGCGEECFQAALIKELGDASALPSTEERLETTPEGERI
ncbi:MAG: hypothetical protein IIA91_09055 [Chloroflexi bacterium]|nr:hypothetical protein [Chloroflexota bacterium]